jgi:hypothetical protein
LAKLEIDQPPVLKLGYVLGGRRRRRRNMPIFVFQRHIRFQPRILLRDIDGCSFIHYLNASLAAKLKAIHVLANGYKLAEFGPERISIDPGGFDHQIPPKFSAKDLSDPWVRIRGKTSSMHSLDFFGWTPKRLVVSRETPSSLNQAKNKYN